MIDLQDFEPDPDGSDFDPTFGVGTDGWVQDLLMDQYRLNHAHDDHEEREPSELDDSDEDDEDDEPITYSLYDASGLRRLDVEASQGL